MTIIYFAVSNVHRLRSNSISSSETPKSHLNNGDSEIAMFQYRKYERSQMLS